MSPSPPLTPLAWRPPRMAPTQLSHPARPSPSLRPLAMTSMMRNPPPSLRLPVLRQKALLLQPPHGGKRPSSLPLSRPCPPARTPQYRWPPRLAMTARLVTLPPLSTRAQRVLRLSPPPPRRLFCPKPQWSLRTTTTPLPRRRSPVPHRRLLPPPQQATMALLPSIRRKRTRPPQLRPARVLSVELKHHQTTTSRHSSRHRCMRARPRKGLT
mmetsp:Transcript_11305/g.30554  ORF Transcript_11305/g.30554 Transcript_11305/m.30554 type:complete len:212 (-) Transcript_11305:876-1511(-)